jgi:glycosyltransferase involved in cell wall biosynthesis
MEENKRLKILTIGDHPLSPSGVGTQTKYIIEGMLATEKYKFLSLGGAMSHHDYTPINVQEYNDNWIILPVDGYGTPDMIRSVLHKERPDILWFMTDPRFWGWLWNIENEIRPLVPMVYYHVWDNYPYPKFNKAFYESNDKIVSISKVTYDIVSTVAPSVDGEYLPHTTNTDIFNIRPEKEVKEFKLQSFPDDKNTDKFLVMFNSRNARRKQSGSLIYWFKAFLDKVGHDKATLIMHTDPKDPHGQDLNVILKELGLLNGQVMLSEDKYPPEILAMMYNMVDCTVSVSDAEGFGLSTFESLSCGTPIIVTMTGGLQEQVTDGEEWFGIGIEPSSKAIIGSQEVPYIYEDRLCEKDVVDALMTMYNMTQEEREKMGEKGRQHILKNYNRDNFLKRWDEVFTEIHEQYGSWESRKNYQGWRLKEVI